MLHESSWGYLQISLVMTLTLAATLAFLVLSGKKKDSSSPEINLVLTDAQRGKIQSLKCSSSDEKEGDQFETNNDNNSSDDNDDDMPQLLDVRKEQVSKWSLRSLDERLGDEVVTTYLEQSGGLDDLSLEEYTEIFIRANEMLQQSSEEDKKQLEESKVLHEKAVAGYMKMTKLMELLKARKHIDEATKLCRRLVCAYEVSHGAFHTETLSAVMILAGMARDQGLAEEARNLYVMALEAYEQTLGADHPYTLRCCTNLAGFFCGLEKFDAAKQLFEQILDRQERTLGADHTETNITVGNLAIVLEQLGDLAGAKILFQRASSKHEVNLGTEHPTTLSVLMGYAKLLGDEGSIDEAVLCYRKVLKGHEQVSGSSSPATLLVAFNLGSLLKDQGRKDEAKELLQRVHAGFVDLFGADHEYTKHASEGLSGCS